MIEDRHFETCASARFRSESSLSKYASAIHPEQVDFSKECHRIDLQNLFHIKFLDPVFQVIWRLSINAIFIPIKYLSVWIVNKWL